MQTLYAPTETGTVIGLDGNEYRYRGGIANVPDQDVPALLAAGFILTTPAPEAVEPAEAVPEEVKKPSRKKKESAE